MRITNNYSSGYTNNEKRIDTLKYELSNEYGYNIDGCKREVYQEENIIKTSCNHLKKENQ